MTVELQDQRRLRQGDQTLGRHVDEQALLQDIHGDDDSLGIVEIVHKAFEPLQRAGLNADSPAFGEEWFEAEFETGGDDLFDLFDLGEKRFHIDHVDRSREEILLIDTRLQFSWHAGKHVAREEWLSETLGLLRVFTNALDRRQVVLETFSLHQGREFFLAARFRVTDEPEQFFGSGKGGFAHRYLGKRFNASM